MARSTALLAALALGCTASVAPAATMTFEDLTTGQALAGQGGWVDSDASHYATVASTTPAHLGAATNVVKGAGTRDMLSLDTDTPFGWSATDTAAVVQADFTPGSGIFSISVGKDGATGSNRGPTFGFYGRDALLRRANPNNSNIQSLQETDGSSDWYRLRLVIDFTANGGDGSADLLLQNLTDGETTYRTVINDVDLDIQSRMVPAAQDPATWDSFFLDVQGDTGMLDNVSVVIPEPASTSLALGGLLLLGLRGARQ